MGQYFQWNPSREAFVFFSYPVYWYSLWFALGFFGAVLITRYLIKKRAQTFSFSSKELPLIEQFTDRLTIFLFIGMLLGARLGHILFYDFSYYWDHPFQIFNLRAGGLSSHGGVVGLCTSLWLFNTKDWKYPFLPKGWDLLDIITIGAAWAACCIRIGNFFNQEIVGIPTTLPWGILFGAPEYGGIARHPVQLYEALSAIFLLCFLLFIGKKWQWTAKGLLTGWFLVLLFSTRVALEFLKTAQCEFDTTGIHMGQLLSLPIIGWGLFLIITRVYGAKSKEQNEPYLTKISRTDCQHDER